MATAALTWITNPFHIVSNEPARQTLSGLFFYPAKHSVEPMRPSRQLIYPAPNWQIWCVYYMRNHDHFACLHPGTESRNHI